MLASAALAGASIILVITAVILPFILRFGMTKAMRIIPIVMVLLFVTAVPVLGDVFSNMQGLTWVNDLLALLDDEEGLAAGMAAVAAVVLALYAASCAVAARLYRGKEL